MAKTKHEVRIVGGTNAAAVLSKSQKDFNRLIKKIETLRSELQEMQAFMPKLQTRIAQELTPLQRQHNELRADMVRLFDRAHDSGWFKAGENKKLRHIIETMSFELIEAGMDDLKAIHDKYAEESYDTSAAEAEEMNSNAAREMFANMFGVDLDDDFDLNDPEKAEAQVREKIAEKQAEEAEKQRAREEARAKRPKTAKQLEREAKQKQEEDGQAKSVREVYMDLVKAFHPDREPDEAEKARKTAIMQRVTAAYDDNDLLALLQLQIEFERIGQDNLATLADDKLRHFNKVLHKQAAELGEALGEMQEQIAMSFNLSMFDEVSPRHLERLLARDLKNLREGIRAAKADLEAFRHDYALKMFLKQYRIQKPKHDEFEDFMEMLVGR